MVVAVCPFVPAWPFFSLLLFVTVLAIGFEAGSVGVSRSSSCFCAGVLYHVGWG